MLRHFWHFWQWGLTKSKFPQRPISIIWECKKRHNETTRGTIMNMFAPNHTVLLDLSPCNYTFFFFFSCAVNRNILYCEGAESSGESDKCSVVGFLWSLNRSLLLFRHPQKEVPFHKIPHKLFELMRVWIHPVWRERLAYQSKGSSIENLNRNLHLFCSGKDGAYGENFFLFFWGGTLISWASINTSPLNNIAVLNYSALG